jgi:polar amino acid transport system substrate-binding protein
MGSGFTRALLVIGLGLVTLVSSARELRVAGTHFARVFEQSPSGEFTGIGPDLLREICRRTGDTVQFAIYPWVRAQALVEQGQADILVGPYKTPERELRFAFSERAFYQDRMLFYVRADASLQWDGNYGQLHGRRVGIVRGWVYGSAFNQASNTMQIESVPTLESGLLMLVHDRIEMLATNHRNTESILPRMELLGKVRPILPVIDVQNGYFAFPKTREYDTLRGRFNEIFNSMVTSGELARLARKHDVHVP